MPAAGAAPEQLHVLRTEPPAGAPLLLLIHGAGGDHTVWGHQIQALRRHAGLVLPDLPGHGRSAGPARGDVASMAQSLAALAGGSGGRPFFVGGHSMGGAIALQLALDRPGRFAGIALIGAAARLAVSQRVLQAIADDASSAVTMLTRLAYADGTSPEVIEAGRQYLSRCDPQTLLADFTACSRFDVRDRLDDLPQPVLCVTGGADRLVLPAAIEATIALLRRGAAEVVPGAGHLVMIERPDEVNRILAGWIASVTGGSSSPAP